MQITRRTFNGMLAGAALSAGLARADTPAAPLRIGIVGSDNSHAMRFAELCNKTDGAGRRVEGAAVTHLWGVEAERNAEVAEVGAIPNIVANPEDMLGHVDAVICVRRHGRYHLEDARPFLEAGLPVFVDKPLAADRDDAAALIALAQEHGAGFSSFSTLRYARANVEFFAGLEDNAGAMLGGTVAGPADPESEYAGIFFYAIHSVELMHAAFGFGVQSVTVSRTPAAVVAVCRYADDRTVTLNLFQRMRGFHMQYFGASATLSHNVDTGAAYYDGMHEILRIFREGHWPLSAEELLEPVLILEAIEAGMAAPGTAIQLGS